MTYEKKPEIKIDDLHPVNDGFIHSYKASWAEQGIVAYAYLEVIDDNPRNGYQLETLHRRESEHGRMGSRQRDLAERLERQIRERMIAEMQVAGWQMASKAKNHQPVWHHQPGTQANLLAGGSQKMQSTPPKPHDDQEKQQSSQIDGQVKQQSDQAKDQESMSRVRVVHARPITFTCVVCKQEVTEMRFPSHTPLYCNNPNCKQEAVKAKTRARVARYREKHPDVRKKQKA